MAIEVTKYNLPGTEQIVLESNDNTPQADAAMFQAAADWLRTHPDYNLMEVGFHHASIDADVNRGNQLHLYVEPV